MGQRASTGQSGSDQASNAQTGTFSPADQLGSLPMASEAAYLAFMTKNTKEDRALLVQRYRVAQKLIRTKELVGPAIEGFLRTPREEFLRPFVDTNRLNTLAYQDSPQRLAFGSTMTDPDVVAMMTTTLDVKPEHRVLEIGTGSGYQAAILSNLCREVFSIEILEGMYLSTDALLNNLSTDYPGYKNIRRKLADGYFGWEEFAPFDRIIITCAIDHLPPSLLKQLKPGGIIVVPLGPPDRQHIMEVTKVVDAQGRETIRRRDVYNGLGVKFIPFISSQGG